MPAKDSTKPRKECSHALEMLASYVNRALDISEDSKREEDFVPVLPAQVTAQRHGTRGGSSS